MTSRSRRSSSDDALFNLPAGRRGRVERAVDTAVSKARREKAIGDVDVALVTLARAQARAVDHAEATRDVWALARVGGELRETLIRLRLDPTSRGANRDSLADFLRSLTQPAGPDETGPAAVGDPTNPV